MRSVAPSVLRSAEVEVRLIVSPVPAPRLIVPAPIEDRIELGAGERHRVGAGRAGEVAGLDIADVGVRKRRDIAVRHDVEHIRAAAEIDRAEAGQLRAVIVTVSLPLLPVSVSIPATVPSREVDRGAVSSARSGRDCRCRCWRRPGSIRRPTNWPLARLIVSSPPPPLIVSAPVAAGDGVGLGAAGDREAFGLAVQRDGHAGCGAGGRDRLDALDRVRWSHPAC